MAAAPTASRPALLPVRRGFARRDWAFILIACGGLAAASLAVPGVPTYDPTAWILWGREIAHGSLDTVTGPSWKPLPILFTTPFALLGDDLAPSLWLVVARAGGLLGVVMAFRLAARLAGPIAGTLAGAAVLASHEHVYNAFRGNSEGLLVGLSLWAVERHLDGRRAAAFALGLGAALLRPEVWPLWGLYGLWLAWRTPEQRKLVAAGFAVLPLAWFVPEWLASGDPLRAAARARDPQLDSPAFAAFPAAEVLRQSLMLVPLVVGAGALAAIALRRKDRVTLVLAGSAAALLLAVAAMTQGGFSGNLRYVLLPLAFIAVLGGAGWVEAVGAVHRRAGLVAALPLVVLGVAGVADAALQGVPHLHDQARAAEREARSVQDLPRVIALAGGARALNACPAVYATRFQVPAVAWELHRPLERIEIFALPPGATIALRGSRLANDPRFEPVAATERWSVRAAACPR